MTVIDARVRLPQDQRPHTTYSGPARQTEQYDRVLGLTDKMNGGRLVDLLADLDANSIGHAVMHAETEGGESAEALNDALCRVLVEHPDRFTGVGTVDVLDVGPTVAARQAAAATPPHTLGGGSRWPPRDALHSSALRLAAQPDSSPRSESSEPTRRCYTRRPDQLGSRTGKPQPPKAPNISAPRRPPSPTSQ